MSRVYNFSAGPGALPEEVLKQAQEEMLDWHGTGMSVMEMSHRGKAYMSIAAKAEADCETSCLFQLTTKYCSYRVVQAHSLPWCQLIYYVVITRLIMY